MDFVSRKIRWLKFWRVASLLVCAFFVVGIIWTITTHFIDNLESLSIYPVFIYAGLIFNSLFEVKDRNKELKELNKIIDEPLWNELNHNFDQHEARLRLSHNGLLEKTNVKYGWEARYKKGRELLFTVYPKQGYLLVYVPTGEDKKFSSLELRDSAALQDFKKTITIKRDGSL